MPRVQITGADELRRRLKIAGALILDHIEPAVFESAAALHIDAGASVPLDTGDLAQSAFVGGPEIDPEKMRVMATVGYGGEFKLSKKLGAYYAIYVHEGFHFGKKRGNPPKWLERAAKGREVGFAKEIGDAIRAGLAKLGTK
jgi:hypothetical protein